MDTPPTPPQPTTEAQPPVPLGYALPGAAKPKRRLNLVHLLLMVGAVAFLVSVLLPSRSRSREITNRQKCASNMERIGASIRAYADAHGGWLPDSLEQLLLADEELSVDLFICPSSAYERAPGATQAERAANLSLARHCSYIYLGNRGLSTTAPGTTPLLCEPPENHNMDGGHVLYLDGQVKFVSPAVIQGITQPAGGATQPLRLPGMQ